MSDIGKVADIGYEAKWTAGGDDYYFIDIGDFGDEIQLVKATNTGSPDGREEWIFGLKDGSEFSVNLNFDPDDASACVPGDEFTDSVLTFPAPEGLSNGATATFDALIVSTKAAIPVGDRMTQTIRIKINSDITYAVAS